MNRKELPSVFLSGAYEKIYNQMSKEFQDAIAAIALEQLVELIDFTLSEYEE